MRKALLLISILLLVLGLAQGLPLTAWLAGAPYLAYNGQLEGARIIERRADLRAGRLPTERDLWLVGTSRTMADFSARIVARELGAQLGLTAPLQYANLGNLANSYAEFAALMHNETWPRLLVLEFSPHVMSGVCARRHADPNKGIGGTYADYRLWIGQQERLVSGWLRRLCGLEGLPRLCPETWDAFRKIGLPAGQRRKALYYGLRCAVEGSAPLLQPDGQVYYWSYLPDVAASRLVAPFASSSELATLRRLLGRRPLDCQWRGLERLLDQARRAGCQVVVVRPPVSSRMYALENRLRPNLAGRIKGFLAQRGVAYLDLNPNPYASADGSHIDWFDTAMLSRRLGRRMAGLIPSYN